MQRNFTRNAKASLGHKDGERAKVAKTPQILDFPLWEGDDTTFIAHRKDESGKKIPFSASTVAELVFTSGKTVVRIPGDIAGGAATFLVKSEEVANVRSGATWRVQFTTDGVEEAPVIGKVSRKYV